MSNDSFLPTNYEVPQATGKYLKLQQGQNQFRILSSPILGNEYWNHEGKPVRRRSGDPIDISDIRPNKDGSQGNVKHFWALPVYDYASNEVKVAEFTQKGILNAIRDLVKDEDWADPKTYDLVITRSGEGLETEYSVKPKMPKELSKEAQAAWASTQKAGFNLEALYEGADPFAAIVKAPTKRATVEVAEEETPTPEEEINIDDIEF